MTDADALRVVAALTAYFRQELSNETAVLWAEAARGYDLQDGLHAAREFGLQAQFMPSLAQFLQTIEDTERLRRHNETPALEPGPENPMTWPEFLDANPEVKERVRSNGWLQSLGENA